ncbi:major capsid protein [Siphonobacter sp. SORGH_AS_1065]|uniref:major capsid protein n=1 Tax=Siphonobacter sp. SORGH_AS_1065 TaxID=3041795 RepID=UPI0027853801|nr:major capsid protein [Siphonobacter sp. SORGH_AS_1065]MDQ1088568.1 hypothetical protein [Siphonobacter sp. SORGH_AS_1065]
MEQSLFIDWVRKYFPAIVISITERVNGTGNPLTYLHKTLLRRDFSVSGKWEALSASNTRVMADIVAMDSVLPLKSRDSIGKASGDIPKMGMELKLTEQQLTDLDTLVALKASEQQILAKLFADTSKAITGIHERNEAIFLQGLSTGIGLVEDDKNVGVGIRLDYGYLTANKFGVSTLWSTPATAKPLDDIQKMIDKSKKDGRAITKFYTDSFSFRNMAATTQVMQQYAFIKGFVGAGMPIPDLDQVNEVLQRKFGATIELVDRSVIFEKNGVQSSYKPWAEGAFVAITSPQVGTLTYATLAEKNHKVAGVEYEESEEYILVSKYRTNKPLAEFTASQARVVPVIVAEGIYLLDTKTVQA